MQKINAFYRVLTVFTGLALIAKIAGLLTEWREVPLAIMIAVFIFSGISHFTKLRFEFEKMIPPIFPAKMALVYITGVMEIIGAILLMMQEHRKITSLAMVIFLIAIFPANYYAGKNKMTFRGAQHLSPLTRGLTQVVFIIALLFAGAWI
jgi:uncharacterized membrane protein